MTEMEQRLAALEQKCDRILEQLSALLAEIQALHPEIKSPDKHVKEADDSGLLRCMSDTPHQHQTAQTASAVRRPAGIQERSPQILSVI